MLVRRLSELKWEVTRTARHKEDPLDFMVISGEGILGRLVEDTEEVDSVLEYKFAFLSWARQF